MALVKHEDNIEVAWKAEIIKSYQEQIKMLLGWLDFYEYKEDIHDLASDKRYKVYWVPIKEDDSE